MQGQYQNQSEYQYQKPTEYQNLPANPKSNGWVSMVFKEPWVSWIVLILLSVAGGLTISGATQVHDIKSDIGRTGKDTLKASGSMMIISGGLLLLIDIFRRRQPDSGTLAVLNFIWYFLILAIVTSWVILEIMIAKSPDVSHCADNKEVEDSDNKKYRTLLLIARGFVLASLFITVISGYSSCISEKAKSELQMFRM